MTETHRLTERAVKYTGIFYNNNLKSKSRKDIQLTYTDFFNDAGKYFNKLGGPTLIKADLPIGELNPQNVLLLTTEIVKYLFSVNEKLHISVLTHSIQTTKALQKKIIHTLGYKKNLLIETVSRVQGLTTDVCIFVIPNSNYHRSLEKRLFNVATSRSERHTIIITFNEILERLQIDNEVKKYLTQLDEEFSFYINISSEQKKLS